MARRGAGRYRYFRLHPFSLRELTRKPSRADLDALLNFGDKAIGPATRYFAERTPIPRFYQTHLGERHYTTGKLTVVPFIRLCEELGLP